MGVDRGVVPEGTVTMVDGTHDAVAVELGCFLPTLPHRSGKYR
jgi:hypothetical protein